LTHFLILSDIKLKYGNCRQEKKMPAPLFLSGVFWKEERRETV